MRTPTREEDETTQVLYWAADAWRNLVRTVGCALEAACSTSSRLRKSSCTFSARRTTGDPVGLGEVPVGLGEVPVGNSASAARWIESSLRKITAATPPSGVRSTLTRVVPDWEFLEISSIRPPIRPSRALEYRPAQRRWRYPSRGSDRRLRERWIPRVRFQRSAPKQRAGSPRVPRNAPTGTAEALRLRPSPRGRSRRDRRVSGGHLVWSRF